MSILLDGTLLKSLIDATGGVGALLEIWAKSTLDGDDEVDRATIYRWCKGQLPKNGRLLVRLAALLNVDPFALLTIADGDIAAAADEILEFVQHDRNMPAPLHLARSFFGRRKEWPPHEVAREFFNRPWELREFVHDPKVRCNYYETVALLSSDPAMCARPQVFHFAFRNPNAFAERWLQYGFVIRNAKAAELWHINGHNEWLDLTGETEPVHVETWCGPGPAVFRVASLHGFSLATLQGAETGRRAVRFPG